MRINQTLRFFLQAATVGLAAAFVILFLNPELLGNQRPTVEIRRAPPSGAVPPGAAAPTAAANIRDLSFAAAVEAAAPSVVNIFTQKLVRERSNPLLDDPVFRRFFGNNLPAPQERMQNSLGSGVIISPQGYILTNYHVIQGADDVVVLLRDGRTEVAQLAGSDPETDLAVLQIPLDGLPSITLGNSDLLRVGDLVLAIGNPFGVGQTVTMGIASATGRNRLGINTFENFIQTDAAINPGNSGGALINLRGELVGINTAIFSRSGGSQGIGFAIPAQLAADVMRQIIEQGRVVRGWLGIEARDLPPEIAASQGFENVQGVVVTNLVRDGPAHLAGIQPGDLLTHIDGEPIPNTRSVLDRVTRQQPGTRILISASRAGERFAVQATIRERPISRSE
ncbi:MAG: PDZ domain-containing protein [Proteobacteria bacterium]|nr:MAG: PDZ domain-containing protein [Pseudomonadota bacterium]